MLEKHQLGFHRRAGIVHEGGVYMAWSTEQGRLSIVGGERVGASGIAVLASIVAIEPELSASMLVRWRANALGLAWRDIQAAPEVPSD